MAKRLVGRRAASHLVPPAEPRTRTHARSHSQPLPRNGNGQRGWSDGLHRGARDRLGRAWSSAEPPRHARPGLNARVAAGARRVPPGIRNAGHWPARTCRHQQSPECGLETALICS